MGNMDRATRGLTAGIIAGIFKNIWNLTDYYFIHITTNVRFLDWVSILSTGSKPKDTFFTIFCLVVQILWDGFLGIIFAYLVNSITSRSVVVKSVTYSLILWFIFKVIVNLYRVPYLAGSQPTPGTMSDVAAIILWGVLLGLTLKKLDKI